MLFPTDTVKMTFINELECYYSNFHSLNLMIRIGWLFNEYFCKAPILLSSVCLSLTEHLLISCEVFVLISLKEKYLKKHIFFCLNYQSWKSKFGTCECTSHREDTEMQFFFELL